MDGGLIGAASPVEGTSLAGLANVASTTGLDGFGEGFMGSHYTGPGRENQRLDLLELFQVSAV
jgi:hypothetical protein